MQRAVAPMEHRFGGLIADVPVECRKAEAGQLDRGVAESAVVRRRPDAGQTRFAQRMLDASRMAFEEYVIANTELIQLLVEQRGIAAPVNPKLRLLHGENVLEGSEEA